MTFKNWPFKVYDGAWDNGEGQMTYDNGIYNVYVGNWEKGKPSGRGKMTYKPGGKYGEIDGIFLIDDPLEPRVAVSQIGPYSR